MKKRVRTKYSEQFEFDAISNTLGMEKSALASQSEEGGGIITLITSIDWRYQMWKVGITMTDNVRKPFELEKLHVFKAFLELTECFHKKMKLSTNFHEFLDH